MIPSDINRLIALLLLEGAEFSRDEDEVYGHILSFPTKGGGSLVIRPRGVEERVVYVKEGQDEDVPVRRVAREDFSGKSGVAIYGYGSDEEMIDKIHVQFRKNPEISVAKMLEEQEKEKK